ncbi:MAG: hypothetical protein A2015_02815 [Spirochaetes bacterium GWF1_31_7]|nr:MAG: hypothetical protein A2Y30_10050 [Spirochaetes bacterium GWE1_32_154]OHD49398.1 MAG: hypothetical protein A2015_02815 [Spirochaetes bacterium GWF1_31_7]OHD51109.1 MAG: hypothetical protein A2Y29_07475 [Spirochaetes bacterium GWE2_31_10]HBD94250.1 hypothetical protein [Spirochaetia bacterium]HBI36199.1 hypothetical protein [Spirochaetia bacterium]
MRKFMIIPLFFIFLSCMSTDMVKENTDKAKKELSKIESEYLSGDIEENIENFKSLVKESGKDVSDFISTTGKPVTEEFLTDLKRASWKNEIKKYSKDIANEIKNIDSKKLEDYLKKIKEYSKKLGISLAETITLVVEYVSKASDDFSKSDFIKKFSDIWLF